IVRGIAGELRRLRLRVRLVVAADEQAVRAGLGEVVVDLRDRSVQALRIRRGEGVARDVEAVRARAVLRIRRWILAEDLADYCGVDAVRRRRASARRQAAGVHHLDLRGSDAVRSRRERVSLAAEADNWRQPVVATGARSGILAGIQDHSVL